MCKSRAAYFTHMAMLQITKGIKIIFGLGVIVIKYSSKSVIKMAEISLAV
jgi:hypothetical protein